MSAIDPEERARLGRRFPIEVVKYDPHWVDLYEEEAEFLRAAFCPNLAIRIEHFGSTAVPGMAAKPVIDILMEVISFDSAKKEIITVLEKRVYIYGWQEEPPPGHMMLWKGYEPEAPQKYHLHLAPGGHPLLERLLFRDYLRAHPKIAQSYEKLKYHLAALHRHDREEYTKAKADFIKEITERAKKELEKGE